MHLELLYYPIPQLDIFNAILHLQSQFILFLHCTVPAP